MDETKTRLIIIGGFLGAGKTTLLHYLSHLMTKNGKSTALITNDQGEELVDTKLLSKTKATVREISDGCFCCRFESFLATIKDLVNADRHFDFVIAEPVGSCTDLSATVFQPLKKETDLRINLSPLSVLADPAMLMDILNGDNAGLHPGAAYIYRKQLEEADVILISKIDTLLPSRLKLLYQLLEVSFPGRKVFGISANSDKGVLDWLNYISDKPGSKALSLQAGGRIAEVDYDLYATGEAALGWLNASIILHGRQVDWDVFLRSYFSQLITRLNQRNAKTGHIKILMESANDQFSVGNLIGNNDDVQYRNKAGSGNIAQMTVNARVELEPATLSAVTFEALAETVTSDMFYEIKKNHSIHPGYPKPVHRYKDVVA